MKHVAAYIIIAIVLLSLASVTALADGEGIQVAEQTAQLSAPTASPEPVETDTPQPAVTPGADEASPEHSATAETTPLPSDEALRMIEGAALNLDSVSIELDMEGAQRVRVAELSVNGVAEGVSVDWYVSSHTGNAAHIELEPSEQGNSVYVYATANAAGQSEYDITCRCAVGLEQRELSAQVVITVNDAPETVPAQIEGIDLVYRMDAGEFITISPSNADDFPQGTQWTLTARKTGLQIDGHGSEFTVSSMREGRYVALITAVAPEGTSRMAYMMFEIGCEAKDDAIALNLDSLDISLDVQGANAEASYFVQAANSLAYLPAEWTLTADADNGAAQLSIEPMASGAMLYATPVREGVDEYTLTCHIPSLDSSVSIPVSVHVRESSSSVTGIALRREQYSLSLDEAITLSPYALPQGEDYPEDTLWTVYQTGKISSYLSLDINEHNGQTTVLAFRPGIYTLEFSAEISANRIYTTSVELIVTK